jgi:flagellar hook assembly protein FlgD
LKKFFAALRSQASSATAQLASLTNGPNPFVSGTMLSFTLTKVSESDAEARSAAVRDGASVPVTVEIYSSEGRRVRKLVDAQYVSGTYRVPFDALDEAGRPLSRGVYFARLQAGGSIVNRKLVLTR